jgi:hypothetical protein
MRPPPPQFVEKRFQIAVAHCCWIEDPARPSHLPCRFFCDIVSNTRRTATTLRLLWERGGCEKSSPSRSSLDDPSHGGNRGSNPVQDANHIN